MDAQKDYHLKSEDSDWAPPAQETPPRRNTPSPRGRQTPPPSRLLFVVMFENLVAVTAIVLKLAIPDISSALKYKIRREVSELWVYGQL